MINILSTQRQEVLSRKLLSLFPKVEYNSTSRTVQINKERIKFPRKSSQILSSRKTLTR